MTQYATLVAAGTALLVSLVSGFVLVPLLHRLKFGQTINEEGPAWHKGKQGTPTMGGVLFILGSLLGVAVAYPMLENIQTDADPLAGLLVLLGLFTSLAFAFVGFVDDYLKVVRKKNLGLRAREKLVMQFAIAGSFLLTLHMMGRLSTLVRLPFLGAVDFGLLFYPLSLILIVGLVNAVNLTDGIDGLASLTTLCVMCGYALLLTLFARFQLSVWAAAVAGALVGFLFWNFYPAKVFMGDTGSMFLGGTVVALGYCMGRPDILFILSLLFLGEAVSVMMQVGWFKYTKRKYGAGRRIFKMTPLHHHFEMSGWSEVKIDLIFSMVTLFCVVIAYLYAFLLG